MTATERYDAALALLKKLIATPSFSKEEAQTAALIRAFFVDRQILTEQIGNNIIVKNRHFDAAKPTLLLNSHHDTVKPNAGYTLDPYAPIEKDGKLYGLGSNDAGGCLVALALTFIHFYDQRLPYNLVFVASAEEENSGAGGIESVLPHLPTPTFALVGEPTEMNMAVAEKGLMVLDCYTKGVAGHAARDTGTNAIYAALPDIEWFRTHQFPLQSKWLGPVKMTVTQINAGQQHNVIPDTCHVVVDVRSTDAYTNDQLLQEIRQAVSCEVKPRSTRLNPSFLPDNLLISKVADDLGIVKFGSPTTSDQALMPFPSFKMGPGRSERSHTPDEFIFLSEIANGIEGYIRLLAAFFNHPIHTL